MKAFRFLVILGAVLFMIPVLQAIGMEKMTAKKTAPTKLNTVVRNP